ncbi:replicative DNA helicase [Formicincola oecophyllae]|uniref:Replicative DNA helicase n=1 Tax=Formicincola oecophyllae TaxID=2558361 RepID=A0A4Y6U830_9PROT|nr:replicative DNA helicase [Formicincola oecophyllae]QDH13324.1 replicative DNA helicase [Formicincola oecophyllae]
MSEPTIPTTTDQATAHAEEAPGQALLLRSPPANLDAEKALLGAILTNNRAYEHVADFLEPHHFADITHQQLFQIIGGRIAKSGLANAITLKGELEHSNVLENVGGLDYLKTLMKSMVGIINAREYGIVIHDCWVRRQLIEIGETVVNDAYSSDSDFNGSNQIETAEQKLFDLASDRNQQASGFTSFENALADALEVAELAFKRTSDIVGLSSGLRDFDLKTGGLHPSDLLILAGRPAMGKTALATKIAFSAAQSLMREAEEESERQGRRINPKGMVAIFSLEMSASQLATRILSEQSEVSGERIRRGDVGTREFDRFIRVSRELQRLPLYIDDTPAITMAAMRTRCRRLKRTKGLALVVVDYLQLMKAGSGRSDNRVLEISMITQGLKALAKEMEVPVIALSQLSRQVESREDKRPMLSDLRESGSIEQDADAVMFVYRDEYYLQQRQPKENNFEDNGKYIDALQEWQRKMELVHNQADLILEKQRHGPTGTIKLKFEGEFTRFSDYDGPDE